VPLVAGERAPFAGQLLTAPLALSLGQAADHCAERIELEVAHTSSIAAVKAAYEAQLALLDLRALERERDAYRAAYEAQKSWWRDPLILVPLTAVLTLGLVYTSVQISK
jgi:hypothetical protein